MDFFKPPLLKNAALYRILNPWIIYCSPVKKIVRLNWFHFTPIDKSFFPKASAIAISKLKNGDRRFDAKFSLQKSPTWRIRNDAAVLKFAYFIHFRSPWFAKKNEFNEDECSFQIRTHGTYPFRYFLIYVWRIAENVVDR